MIKLIAQCLLGLVCFMIAVMICAAANFGMEGSISVGAIIGMIFKGIIDTCEEIDKKH